LQFSVLGCQFSVETGAKAPIFFLGPVSARLKSCPDTKLNDAFCGSVLNGAESSCNSVLSDAEGYAARFSTMLKVMQIGQQRC
jgi:hypothetical protein